MSYILPKFKKCLLSTFLNAEKDPNTFYFIRDTNEFFLGTIPLSSSIFHEVESLDNVTGVLGHIYYNSNTGVFYIYSGLSFLPLNASAALGGAKINYNSNACTNLVVADKVDKTITVKWNDPVVFTTEFGTVDTWARSLLVGNPDHMPTSVSDGTVLAISTVRNQYGGSNSFTFTIEDVTPGYHIKVFAQCVDGTYSSSSASPSVSIGLWEATDLDEYMDCVRAGGDSYTLVKTAYPVGSVLPFVSHNTFTQMSWMIAHYDYKGGLSSVSDYLCGDSTKTRNVVLYPLTVPSKPNGAQLLIPYDPIEASSALSVDTEFISGKTYYTSSSCTTAFNTSNANPGDTPVSLGLYEKGVAVAGNGYGPYLYSFIRRFLNADAVAGSWYTPNSIFEPASVSFANDYDGFYYGLDSITKSYIHLAKNRYTLYTGSVSWCEDRVFLPTYEQVYGNNTYKFQMFINNTTNDFKIPRSANGTAVYAWLGSQPTNVDDPSGLRNISTSGVVGTAGKLGGGQQGKDCAMPVMVLA